MVEIFEEIYKGGNWGPGSGPGSSPEGLAPYYTFLEKLLRAKKPGTVLDLGCGYFAPYKDLDWQDTKYIGVDIVRQCVDENLKYADANREFFLADWTKFDHLQDADFVICKDVLQHWCHDEIRRGLERISKYRYCLITNSIRLGDQTVNADILTGLTRPLNLLIEPYSLTASDQISYDVVTNSQPDQKLSFLWEPKVHPLHPITSPS